LRLLRSASAAVWLLLLVLAFPPLSGAAEADPSLQAAESHLEAWRVPEADAAVARLLRAGPPSPAVLDLLSRIRFYEGRYEEALGYIQKALAAEADPKRHSFHLLIQQTRDTVGRFTRHESAHFILHLDERRDGILAPLALDALEKSYAAVGKELGYLPREKIRVEIAPDASSFNAISTLSLRDIEETGAVGICKFNKVMIISPRALLRGYRWLDSLSHEYLHYVIVALTNNNAPIWLHEGMARFYETRWRRPVSSKESEDYLTPSNQTLLAQALEKDLFVGFKKMEPSLIYLETPEQVQLAYAEAASAIDFMVHQKGPSAMRHLLADVAQASTAEAIEKLLAMPFDRFQEQWKAFLKQKGLKEVEGSRVRKLKVKQDGKEGEEEAVDLKEIQSAVARNQVHLADQMLERGRTVAAGQEYRRALRASPHSPIILNKLARVLLQMRKHDEALPHLQKAQTLDPDNVLTYIQLGRLHHAAGKHAEAQSALEQAIQLNPFDPGIYRTLVDVHTALGNQAAVQRSQSTLKRLMQSR
jgi:tetratricopeptide (TPR) repeat protein